MQNPHQQVNPEPDLDPQPQHFHETNKKADTKKEEEAANSGTPGNAYKSRDLGQMMSYPHYDKDYLENIKPKHLEPEKVVLLHFVSQLH